MKCGCLKSYSNEHIFMPYKPGLLKCDLCGKLMKMKIPQDNRCKKKKGIKYMSCAIRKKKV